MIILNVVVHAQECVFSAQGADFHLFHRTHFFYNEFTKIEFITENGKKCMIDITLPPNVYVDCPCGCGCLLRAWTDEDERNMRRPMSRRRKTGSRKSWKMGRKKKVMKKSSSKDDSMKE
jgi:hypothetical protein